MARTVDINEAKRNLSQLLDRAASGEEIIISVHGIAKARLELIVAQSVSRKPGSWKGKGWIGPDFDDPLPDDILRAFNAEGD